VRFHPTPTNSNLIFVDIFVDTFVDIFVGITRYFNSLSFSEISSSVAGQPLPVQRQQLSQ